MITEFVEMLIVAEALRIIRDAERPPPFSCEDLTHVAAVYIIADQRQHAWVYERDATRSNEWGVTHIPPARRKA